jgi:protein-disulfide isomerase
MSRRNVRATVLVTAVLAVVLVFVVIFTHNKGDKTDEAKPSNIQSGQLKGFDPKKQPFVGNPDAPVVLVEFADYKCPACKRWTEDVYTRLKDKYLDTGKAVFYYVDLPFLAPDSTYAALAGETLFQQNSNYFWTYYKLMMEHQGKKEDTWATKEFVMNLVSEYIPEVDMERFERELDAETYIENVWKDVKIGDDSEVGGTPTLFLNGVEVEDISFEGLQQAIDNQ